MDACPECDGLLIQDDGSDDFLIEPIDSYYCPGCGWSSNDIGDPEELDDDADAWMCTCGNYEESGLHCSICGNEPPWGCPCSGCSDSSSEELEEWEYSDY